MRGAPELPSRRSCCCSAGRCFPRCAESGAWKRGLAAGTRAELRQLTTPDTRSAERLNPAEEALSTTLQTGAYTAYLVDWNLERDDGSGTFFPIQARLISSYAVDFSVFNGTTTTVSYQFDTDGVIVTVGSGTLKVTVAVDETSAVCTPFADDCGPDSWCPPTGLTGAPRACVTAGIIARGQPCSAPSDCVANTSCFDLGSGPICAELCPVDVVGAECASGGTCAAAGRDYGVCNRAPSTNP